MAQQSGAAGEQSPLGAATESSSDEDEDGVARGGMERVPSFDLDATGAGPASGPARRRFDPDMAAQHRYLGDVDDLGGGASLLEEGATYTLPLFPLDGVVLLPGESLPLFLHSPRDILKLERALRLPPGEPTARLIAVTHECWRSHMSLVGCSAEIRRLRRHGDPQQHALGGRPPEAAAVVALVARGRQRLSLDRSALADTFRVRVQVLPEGLAEAPPRQLSAGAAFWPPWAARPFDAPALAARVQQLCSGVLPQIASKLGPSHSAQHGPLALQRYGYWLGSNLPLSAERRQQLLECRDTAERLRLLLGWLTRLGGLACKNCGSQVTHCSSALLMSSEGAGGAFVNAHGFVHDIATFRAVQRLSYQGQPETAHSWFPGYAWTIASCACCGDHLGWRFTACSEDLQPAVFWGLRRSAITCPELQPQRQRPHRRAAAAVAAVEAAAEAMAGGRAGMVEGQPAAAAGRLPAARLMLQRIAGGARLPALAALAAAFGLSVAPESESGSEAEEDDEVEGDDDDEEEGDDDDDDDEDDMEDGRDGREGEV